MCRTMLIIDRLNDNLTQKGTKYIPGSMERGVCVCVVIPFILDVRRRVDAPAEVTHARKVAQGFSAFLLRCLP